MDRSPGPIGEDEGQIGMVNLARPGEFLGSSSVRAEARSTDPDWAGEQSRTTGPGVSSPTRPCIPPASSRAAVPPASLSCLVAQRGWSASRSSWDVRRNNSTPSSPVFVAGPRVHWSSVDVTVGTIDVRNKTAGRGWGGFRHTIVDPDCDARLAEVGAESTVPAEERLLGIALLPLRREGRSVP